jgi:hypothetical protein
MDNYIDLSPNLYSGNLYTFDYLLSKCMAEATLWGYCMFPIKHFKEPLGKGLETHSTAFR